MALHGLTHAQPARGVQRQALGALAAEGAGSVEALPIGTDPGEDLALVHIWAGTEKEDSKGWSCSPGGSGHPGCPCRGGKEQCQPWGLGSLRGRPGYQGGGISVSTSKDFRTPGIPHDLHLSMCSSGVGVNYRGAGSYLHR